jgi:TolA-binding protein
MKTLFFILALIIGSILLLNSTLQNGSFLQYLDTHPNPQWVPMTEYYVGEGYYLFQNLEQAATYFIRVPNNYPTSEYADEAYWSYLLALDDSAQSSRALLVEEYQKYIDYFPHGAHAQAAQNKIDAYKSGGR